jgi:hypothetical protein
MAEPKPISVHHRVLACDALDALARQANQLAVWLDGLGYEVEADKLERSAEQLAAAAWLLNAPLRGRPHPPAAWADGIPDGHQTARGPAGGAYPQASAPPRQM